MSKTVLGSALIYGVAFGLLATTALHANRTFADEPVTPKLTPRLHELLIEEMQSIKQAMEKILNGLVVGDHSVVGKTAEQIHDSFILKQQLTKQDKKDLMSAVPQQFVRMDQEFHMTSKKLAEAAKANDYELERFYFGKMVEACQGCHSKYVSDRFSAFSGTQPGNHSH